MNSVLATFVVTVMFVSSTDAYLYSWKGSMKRQQSIIFWSIYQAKFVH